MSNQLLDALEGMARQNCCYNAKTAEVDSGAISAHADALEILAEHGRFVINRSHGRMVFGHWPEDKEKYKPYVPLLFALAQGKVEFGSPVVRTVTDVVEDRSGAAGE